MKNGMIKLFIVLALSFNRVTLNALGTQETYYKRSESEIITSGLTYEKETRLTNNGWLDIHVLKMDVNNKNIGIDILRSDKGWGMRDTLTRMAKSNENVVAGINASFFDTSKNQSNIIGPEYDGDYSFIENNYNKKDYGAASFIKTKEDMLIDFFGGKIVLKNEKGKEIYVYGINHFSSFKKTVIFNSNAIYSSLPIDKRAEFYKVVVANDRVKYISSIEENLSMPSNGFIIFIPKSEGEKALEDFTLGEKMSLSIDDKLDSDNLELIISGGGEILKSGKLVKQGILIAPNSRHPRSAIGITKYKDYIISMVVDGRGSSIGATHEEMAKYLLEYDVYDAMYFDGGGSSEMVGRQFLSSDIDIINKPSDGKERKIVNGLGFVIKAPKGEIKDIYIKADKNSSFVGEAVELDVIAYDEYRNIVPVKKEDIIWKTEGIIGNFKVNSFIPSKKSSGKIICKYKGLSAYVELKCIDRYIDMDIEPNVLYIDDDGIDDFKIIATDEYGYKRKIDNNAINWKVKNENIVEFNDGEFSRGDTEGVTTISAKIYNKEINAYVVAGKEKSLISDFEDISISQEVYPKYVSINTKLSNEKYTDGEKAIKLFYNMKKSDETQAAYVLLNDIIIPEKVDSLGINVLGNNNNMMIRGKIRDAEDKEYNITFTKDLDFNGWGYIEGDIPNYVKYPLKLERIYVVTLKAEADTKGILYFDSLVGAKNYDLGIKNYDLTPNIDDNLLVDSGKEYDFTISIFGPTYLEDNLKAELMSNVYDSVNTSDLAIFAGHSDIDKDKVLTESIIYNDSYSVYDYEYIKIINLNTSKGGLFASDANQWKYIIDDLYSTKQDNIVFIANKNPYGFTSKREGEELVKLLKEFKDKLGKNIFYINASGYQYKVDYNEGIRYIDINGLNYLYTSESDIDYVNSFKMLRLHINENGLSYSIDKLF